MTAHDVTSRIAGTRHDQGYTSTHATRFAKSFEILSRHLKGPTKILDVSWPTVFDDLLVDAGHSVRNVDFDARNPWPIGTEASECILLMEVVEHLKDSQPDIFDTFTFTGLRSTLSNAYNALDHGGIILITSPNCASAGAIKRCLLGLSPFIYSPHVREYTARELEWWVDQAGFSILERTTETCYDEPDQRIMDMIARSDYSTELRNDTTFIIATK
jgi:Methyltransferase domain